MSGSIERQREKTFHCLHASFVVSFPALWTSTTKLFSGIEFKTKLHALFPVNLAVQKCRCTLLQVCRLVYHVTRCPTYQIVRLSRHCWTSETTKGDHQMLPLRCPCSALRAQPLDCRHSVETLCTYSKHASVHKASNYGTSISPYWFTDSTVSRLLSVIFHFFFVFSFFPLFFSIYGTLQ